MKQENDLGKDSIQSLVWRIAIPSMLAQFVSVLYSIVDRMYIGNIPVVGETALAGVGIAGPVVTLVGAFAFLIGIGGSPLM
ncbi:MAG: MATE family efflux transporter, partial [Oscillospiraceae bacterium]